jgi:phytoene dehydrogenase-like protein
LSVDNPVQVGAGLSTPVRRLGREKLAERTIETVLQLTPDTETVAATLHAAGLRFSRKAEAVRREAARSVRTEAKGFDFSIFADLDELQEQARLSLQEAVDTFLHLLAQAEDERFQIEQITQNTTVEQRLNDPAFRARRETAGRILYPVWHGGHWIAGAWGAFGKVFDAFRKANPARPGTVVSNDTGSARQDLVARKIISLNAWKTAGR